MMAVWRGLQAASVRRRRLVRANSEAMQDPMTLTLFAHLSQLCSHKSSGMQSLVRLHDAQHDVPCVPLLDGFLAILANVNQKYGPDTMARGLLHLRKARHVAQAVKRMVRHQHWRYHFAEIKPVEAYLSDLLVLDSQTLMTRSRSCEA
eukprot:CAMPEP_0179446254 /NCGR_PEP_ID=MMETSP0799-20121207/29650_1 /TAXON_ID=46947 /ORGANISM="Geminigera cryophila, Strain CCMP2564" /LENGTH=147 /DNA_ID=CAMNT_0021235013 /DNA_START=53 /DNA_END=496 /DNA_ORIENTATION=-